MHVAMEFPPILGVVASCKHGCPRSLLFASHGAHALAYILPYSSVPHCRNVVAHVRNRYPRSLLFAAGWSLGANIMTRYLGKVLG